MHNSILCKDRTQRLFDLWTIVDLFGHLQTIMDNVGQFWTYFDIYGKLMNKLDEQNIDT